MPICLQVNCIASQSSPKGKGSASWRGEEAKSRGRDEQTSHDGLRLVWLRSALIQLKTSMKIFYSNSIRLLFIFTPPFLSSVSSHTAAFFILNQATIPCISSSSPHSSKGIPPLCHLSPRAPSLPPSSLPLFWGLCYSLFVQDQSKASRGVTVCDESCQTTTADLPLQTWSRFLYKALLSY